jgi:hypothetical protein
MMFSTSVTPLASHCRCGQQCRSARCECQTLAVLLPVAAQLPSCIITHIACFNNNNSGIIDRCIPLITATNSWARIMGHPEVSNGLYTGPDLFQHVGRDSTLISKGKFNMQSRSYTSVAWTPAEAATVSCYTCGAVNGSRDDACLQPAQ